MLMIGCSTSRWAVYTENPFPKGPPHVEATWQPEGSLIREYLTFLVNDRLERQAARCSKANVCMYSLQAAVASSCQAVRAILMHSRFGYDGCPSIAPSARSLDDDGTVGSGPC